MQVPRLENRINSISLKDNMAMVVITIKAIQESIKHAEADKKYSHADAIEQLKVNLAFMFERGKQLQSQMKFIESRNERALLSIPT